MKKIKLDYLEKQGIELDKNSSSGIVVIVTENEMLIKGSKTDLIDLADYITNVAISDCNNDHLHLDDLTIVSKESMIKNLVIEKSK